MCSGVGKSGSPAPKPMTFSPAALRALALASIAMVGDSVISLIRWASRSGVMGAPPLVLPAFHRAIVDDCAGCHELSRQLFIKRAQGGCGGASLLPIVWVRAGHEEDLRCRVM